MGSSLPYRNDAPSYLRGYLANSPVLLRENLSQSVPTLPERIASYLYFVGLAHAAAKVRGQGHVRGELASILTRSYSMLQ